MKRTRTTILIPLLLLHLALFGQEQGNMICRQGKVAFFSYTSVENIEAVNNQVVSVLNLNKKEIGVQMLMRAFVFKKALMEEHFNESYVESDIYPKLTFSGSIADLDGIDQTAIAQIATPRLITGTMDFHGVQKEVKIMVQMENQNDNLVLTGDFNVAIDDFDIKVPPLLIPNIAKDIQVTFRFEYTPYEE